MSGRERENEGESERERKGERERKRDGERGGQVREEEREER